MRTLKKKGKNMVNEVTVPFRGSNFAASSQVPESSDNPLPPPPMSAPFLGLNVNVGDHFTPEAMYDDPIFTDKHQPFAYPQDTEESGYLPSPYVLVPGHPFAEDHQAGGYHSQLQFHQLPTSVQQEQAFSNYRVAEDTNQVFAGRYYREAMAAAATTPAGSADIVAKRLAMLAIADEGPSLNPPPAGGCF